MGYHRFESWADVYKDVQNSFFLAVVLSQHLVLAHTAEKNVFNIILPILGACRSDPTPPHTTICHLGFRLVLQLLLQVMLNLGKGTCNMRIKTIRRAVIKSINVDNIWTSHFCELGIHQIHVHGSLSQTLEKNSIP